MKYRKGMKFRSLTNSPNHGIVEGTCRKVGNIYTVEFDDNYTINYRGEQGQSCEVMNKNEIEFIKEIKNEIDYLNSFQFNFRNGV